MENWPATKIVKKRVADLIPYAQNSRTHSEAQVIQIAESMKEFGWTMPMLIDEKNEIIAGHGRLLAAQRLGITKAPCMIAVGWTEEQRRAYTIADNKLAENAGWNMDLLRSEFKFLEKSNFSLGLTGFSKLEIGGIFKQEREQYSRKIEAPIYEIKGYKPKTSDLYDEGKASELRAEIAKAELPEDVAAFLNAAADRHTVFNFRNIAEFYAHADAKTQDLMERSALIIIDFDRAIEDGFVKLSKDMMDQVAGIKSDA